VQTSCREDKGSKQAMEDFRIAQVRVLIASDVAARGLDIKGITHVFNLDVPTQSKAYLHRVGRTARAGAKGQAVSLMTGDEVRLVRRYESELGIGMHRVRLREGRVIAAEADESR
jgi:superfamily II DNA/RNA helicase